MIIDVKRGVASGSPLGSLLFDADNQLTVEGADRTSSLIVDGLRHSDWARVWVSSSWICIMGERGHEVVLYDPSDAADLAVVGSIDRLELGASDPGGMHVVNFFPINEEDLLVETELSIARLSRRSGLLWTTDHAEFTTWVKEVGDDQVICDNGGDQIVYRLSDGMETFSWEDGGPLASPRCDGGSL